MKDNKKGFELLKNVQIPEKYYEAEKKISTLKDIWNGKGLGTLGQNMKKVLLTKLMSVKIVLIKILIIGKKFN